MLPPAHFISTGLLFLPLNPSSPPLSPEFHRGRICFAASHQISVDFSAEQHFRGVHELPCVFIGGAPRPVNHHLLWNKNQWALKCDFVARDQRRLPAKGPLARCFTSRLCPNKVPVGGFDSVTEGSSCPGRWTVIFGSAA